MATCFVSSSTSPISSAHNSPITSPSRSHHTVHHKSHRRRRSKFELQPNVTITSPTKSGITHKHPEYHFFSPKYNQKKPRQKTKHRRKLSLDHREECYQFMKYLQCCDVPTKRKKLLPPKSDKKYTLVLDLDETLVHCSTLEMVDHDFIFCAHFNDNNYTISGRKRPGLLEFLKKCAKDWEVVVFTASTSQYADKVCDLLDPTGTLISHRLFREACTNVDGNYIKDLSSLGRDLKTTLIVDNSPHTFSLQVSNGIPIESWYEEHSDIELDTLYDILSEIKEEDDVRKYISEEFRVQELLNNIQF